MRALILLALCGLVRASSSPEPAAGQSLSPEYQRINKVLESIYDAELDMEENLKEAREWFFTHRADGQVNSRDVSHWFAITGLLVRGCEKEDLVLLNDMVVAADLDHFLEAGADQPPFLVQRYILWGIQRQKLRCADGGSQEWKDQVANPAGLSWDD